MQLYNTKYKNLSETDYNPDYDEFFGINHEAFNQLPSGAKLALNHIANNKVSSSLDPVIDPKTQKEIIKVTAEAHRKLIKDNIFSMISAAQIANIQDSMEGQTILVKYKTEHNLGALDYNPDYSEFFGIDETKFNSFSEFSKRALRHIAYNGINLRSNSYQPGQPKELTDEGSRKVVKNNILSIIGANPNVTPTKDITKHFGISN